MQVGKDAGATGDVRFELRPLVGGLPTIDDRGILYSTSIPINDIPVISALAEARRRRLRSIAMVGYDGGRVAADGLADHVVVTRSEHIPRIQEAQASAYHLLRELVA